MTRVAFTGTQQGMTGPQRARFRGLMSRLQPSAFYHGDCVGADSQAHDDAVGFVPVHIHPCTVEDKRAYCEGATTVAEPLPPLERNRVMVDLGEALVATPKSMEEELRSGTWATVRYARKTGKPVHIVWPNGTYTGPSA